MKKAKMFFTAIAVLTIVSGALAFKARQLNFKKYTCDVVHNQCVLTDPTHNYRVDAGSPFIPNATITDQGAPVGSCADQCPGINGAVE
jgi:CDP-diacylglycerol pyrophosphatase